MRQRNCFRIYLKTMDDKGYESGKRSRHMIKNIIYR